MIPEVEVLQHVDDVVVAVLILFPQVVQDADLDQRLVVEPLLVPYYLYGDMFVGHVVQGSDDLPETALAYYFQDLVAIADMVVQNLEQIK